MFKTKNLFWIFLLYIWNEYQIFNILKKKMTLMGYVFLKLATAKDVATQMSRESRFSTSFDSQHVRESETLVRISRPHLQHIVL